MCTYNVREMRRKEERSKQGQTNKKAKQHSTPKAVTFLEKNELPQGMHMHIEALTHTKTNKLETTHFAAWRPTMSLSADEASLLAGEVAMLAGSVAS